MNSPLVEALRTHDRAIQRSTTSSAFDEHMRQAISAGPPKARPRWSALASAVAGVAMLVGAGSWLATRTPVPPGEENPPEAVARFVGQQVPITDCQRDFELRVVHLRGRCTLEVEGPGVTVQTWTRATIEPRGDGLIVHDGLVLVDVERVSTGGAPVRVGVGGGTIEVLGTQFVIYEGTSGGEVELLEGAIRFAREDGQTIEMEVGDRARWAGSAETPAPAQAPAPEVVVPVIVPAPSVAPARPESSEVEPKPASPSEPPRTKETRARAPAPSAEDLNATLVEVARLRELGHYGGALTRLRDFRRGVRLPGAMAEVVSFEEGSLLEARGADEEACKHWLEHAGRFPKGRYASEVRRHSERLGCVREPEGN